MSEVGGGKDKHWHLPPKRLSRETPSYRDSSEFQEVEVNREYVLSYLRDLKILYEEKDTSTRRPDTLIKFFSSFGGDGKFTLYKYQLDSCLDTIYQSVRDRDTGGVLADNEARRVEKSIWDQNVWVNLSRLSGEARSRFTGISRSEKVNIIELIEWFRKDPIAADVFTRDHDFFSTELASTSRYFQEGDLSAHLSKMVREETYKETKRIARIIREAGIQTASKVLQQIREKLGLSDDYPSELLLDRIQIVSQDRGGKLLTYGLLASAEFSPILQERISTSFKGVKVESWQFWGQNRPEKEYGVDSYDRVRSHILRDGRDVVLLIDLAGRNQIGGRHAKRKQFLLHRLFEDIDPEKVKVFTAGTDETYNDIHIDAAHVEELDDLPRVFGAGRKSIQGESIYYWNEAPPFPWRWLFTTNGEKRLKKWLEI